MVRTRASVRHSIVSGLAFEQHALDAHQVAGQENHHDLPTVIFGRAGSRDPAGLQQVDRSAVPAGTDKRLTLTVEAGRPHSLSDYRVTTDQQIAQLRAVQRIINI
jgi:hypothetical protein